MNTLDPMAQVAPQNRPLSKAHVRAAKAYRGVPYVDAHGGQPVQISEPRRLTYRGVPYVHAHAGDAPPRGGTRHLTYRGQSYERRAP